MSDPVWKREEVASPCVNICVIHPQTRLCTGCARSIDEIAAWSSMGPDRRNAIMSELPGRTPAPTIRRGGRAARIKRA